MQQNGHLAGTKNQPEAISFERPVRSIEEDGNVGAISKWNPNLHEFDSELGHNHKRYSYQQVLKYAPR